MKNTKRAISLLLALIISLGALMLPSVAAGEPAVASGGSDTAGTYTKKVVSILYDNSGSMVQEQREHYAKYAIQALAALLGPEDVLLMTPMNQYGSSSNAVVDNSYTYEVDLSNSDRNAQIARMLSDSFLHQTPNGLTPFGPIDIVLQNLVDRGMTSKNGSGFEQEGAEYWLFVMTDGVFTNMSLDGVEAEYAKYIKNYNNFHMVHLGFGSGATDMSVPKNSELRAASNYSSYHSGDTSKLMETMRDIANQISGRYTAGSADYTSSGNKITVNLDGLGFAVHNISILMQDTTATLQSATHNGKPLQITQPCTIVPASGLKNQQGKPLGNGYSAVIKPATGLLSGGEMVLTFSDAVNGVSIMVEPALKLRAVVERKDGNNWVPADRVYINSFMKAGDLIRVDYEVVAEGSGGNVDLSALFGNVEEKVTYAGNAYAPGVPIPLVEGSHEIIVNVSAMNGTYQLYDAFSCIVWTDPSQYRIEGEAISTDGGRGNTYDLEFTVVFNNQPLDKAALAAYTWSVQGTDASGAAVSLSPRVENDGTIKASVNLSSLPVGDVVFSARVVSADGFVREKTLTLKVRASLKLHMTVERRDGNGWVEADAGYINRYMKAGDELRAVYKIYDEVNGVYVNAADTIGIFTDEVAYAGATYRPGNPFPLAAGTHEIVVTLTSADSSYRLQDSFTCIALADPNEFRVEGVDVITDGGLGLKRDAKFFVYANNVPLTAAELAAYSWQIKGTDAVGNAMALQPTVSPEGCILVPLNLVGSAYGTIRLEATVTDSNGFTRDTVLEISHQEKTVSATVEGVEHIVKTQYQLGNNADGFRFSATVTAGGVTTALDPALYGYKVTVKGKDVTKYCTVSGANVIFVPTKDNLGELAGRLGELDVTFVVWMTADPALSDSATAKLTIGSTVYEVIVSVEGDGADPFDWKESGLAIYVSARRDGVFLSGEELLAAKDSGALNIDVKGGFLRNGYGFFHTVSAGEHDGMPALRIAPKENMAWLAYCITGMVAFPGERTVNAVYQGVAAADAYEIFHPGAMAYVLRVLIYFLILHIAMLIIGYSSVERFSPGRYVRMVVTLNDHKMIKRATITPKDVGRSFFDRILWRRIFIPCVYWFRGTQTIELEGGKVVLTATKLSTPNARIKYSNTMAGTFVAAMKMGEYEDVAKIRARIKNGLYNGQDLVKMSIDFDERPIFKNAEGGAKSGAKREDAFRNLSDFRNPICIRKVGNPNSMTYTLIFFISDN